MIIPDILLTLLVVLVALLCVTFIMNFWLNIPSVPSPHAVVKTMIDLAKLKGKETVFDLGAGDGRVLIEAKKRYPGIKAIGCELIPTIWALGKIRILLSRQDVTLQLKDALKEDVSSADVVLLYLFPALMDRLVERFDKELKPGTRVVSHTFQFHHKTPVEQKTVRGYWGETMVYVYQW